MDTSLWFAVITVICTLLTVGIEGYKLWLDHTTKIQVHAKKVSGLISKYSLRVITSLLVAITAYTLLASSWPLSRVQFITVILGLLGTCVSVCTFLMTLFFTRLEEVRQIIDKHSELLDSLIHVSEGLIEEQSIHANNEPLGLGDLARKDDEPTGRAVSVRKSSSRKKA
jgi:hypothetical protein